MNRKNRSKWGTKRVLPFKNKAKNFEIQTKQLNDELFAFRAQMKAVNHDSIPDKNEREKAKTAVQLLIDKSTASILTLEKNIAEFYKQLPFPKEKLVG